MTAQAGLPDVCGTREESRLRPTWLRILYEACICKKKLSMKYNFLVYTIDFFSLKEQWLWHHF